MLLPSTFCCVHVDSHRPRVSSRQKNATDSCKLPSLHLNDMQPVALVAVDTERDRLKVQQYPSDLSPRSKVNQTMQRSKSLMSVRYGTSVMKNLDS